MERELWPALYHRVLAVGATIQVRYVTFQPHVLVLILLWAALHDRPLSWACQPRHWSTTRLRPARLPSQSTLTRRLRSIAVGVLMRTLADQLRETVPPRLVQVLDGKPLPVGGASQDPEARCGRGAGMRAKGYKLHAVWSHRPMPEAWSIESLNVCETKAAEQLLPTLPGGGGYLLGDGEYDASPVYDAAGRAGYQLLAPRENPSAGLGHCYQSPYRLRAIALWSTSFGQALYALRGTIERSFGNATSFGGGLGPLPAWVRRRHRVWYWVWAKLLINGVRITKRQRLTA
jgi:Transposase DDE domain